eukprot:gene7880-8731_t
MKALNQTWKQKRQSQTFKTKNNESTPAGPDVGSRHDDGARGKSPSFLEESIAFGSSIDWDNTALIQEIECKELESDANISKKHHKVQEKSPLLRNGELNINNNGKISTPIDAKEKFFPSLKNNRISPILTNCANKKSITSECHEPKEDEKLSAETVPGAAVSGENITQMPRDMLSIESWQLPEVVCERYKEVGIHKMFPWQKECLMTGMALDGGNLVYSAPTSAGKTLVAELLMLRRILKTKRKAIYILPFVSVAREKMFHLQKLFKEAGVNVDGYMGAQAPSGGFASTDIAVCTIEKANSLVNRLMEEKKTNSLGVVVVDEMHMIGDGHRGYLLELMLSKIRFLQGLEKDKAEIEVNSSGPIQIIGMSATLPNLDMFAAWLNADLYVTNYRPVPLNELVKVGRNIFDCNMHQVSQIKQNDVVKGDEEHVVPLCLETIREGNSVLVFCPTKSWCEKLARTIADHFKQALSSGELKKKAVESIDAKKNTETLEDDEIKGHYIDTVALLEVIEQLRRSPAGLDHALGSVVAHGISFHHAGLTFDERDVIESAFRRGIVRVVIATSTLSSGVNLPARRVIIRTPVFHGKTIDSLVYKQMCGRAGRKGVDTKGESILICKANEKAKGSSLLRSNLKPVYSCLLDAKGEDDIPGMKRALLEIIAAGVASTAEHIERYATCTFLNACLAANKSTNPTVAIRNTIKFLSDNEFIRLQTDANSENGVTLERYQPTQLGSATLASALSPDEALVVFRELKRARKCFVLENELHIVYQMMPVYMQSQWPDLDWYHYFTLFDKLPPQYKRVGEIVGVQEGYLAKAIKGRLPTRTAEQRQRLAVHQRFYSALVLLELINEISLRTVSRRYNVSKGLLQSLQSSASTFAGMVTKFCEKLGWRNLEILFEQFQSRLSFGVSRELCDLVRITSLNGTRARLLFNAGYHTVGAVAAASISDLTKLLVNSAPFESKKNLVQGEDMDEVMSKNKARCIWVTGKEGLTEEEAAILIINEAKEILQGDAINLGLDLKDVRLIAMNKSNNKEHVNDGMNRGENNMNRNRKKRDSNIGSATKTLAREHVNDEINRGENNMSRNGKNRDSNIRSAAKTMARNLKRKTSQGNEIRATEKRSLENDFAAAKEDVEATKKVDVNTMEISSDKTVQETDEIDLRNVVKDLDVACNSCNVSANEECRDLELHENKHDQTMAANVEQKLSEGIDSSSESGSGSLILFGSSSSCSFVPSNRDMAHNDRDNAHHGRDSANDDRDNAHDDRDSAHDDRDNANDDGFANSDGVVDDGDITPELFSTSLESDGIAENMKERVAIDAEHGNVQTAACGQNIATDDDQIDLNDHVSIESRDNTLYCESDDSLLSKQSLEICLKLSDSIDDGKECSEGEKGILEEQMLQDESIGLNASLNFDETVSICTAGLFVEKAHSYTNLKAKVDQNSEIFDSSLMFSQGDLFNDLMKDFQTQQEENAGEKPKYKTTTEIKEVSATRGTSATHGTLAACGTSATNGTSATRGTLATNGTSVTRGKDVMNGIELKLEKSAVPGAVKIKKNSVTEKLHVQKLAYGTDRHGNNHNRNRNQPTGDVIGISVCWGGKDSYYVKLDGHSTKQNSIVNRAALGATIEEAFSIIAEQLSERSMSVEKIVFDLKNHVQVLQKSCAIGLCGRFSDPKVASWLFDPSAKEFTLYELVLRYLSDDYKDIIKQVDVNGFDTGSIGLESHSLTCPRLRSSIEAVTVYELMSVFESRLQSEGLHSSFTDIEMPVMLTLGKMETNGIGFSAEKCKMLETKLKERMCSIENKCQDLIGHRISLTSPEDIAHALFIELKLPPNGDPNSLPLPQRGNKKSRLKVRHLSTAKDVLEKLKDMHPLPMLILEWRRVHNALVKNVYPMQRSMSFSSSDSMNRIFFSCYFHTVTGRIMVAEPNLQNIPKEFEIRQPADILMGDGGKEDRFVSLRKSFVPFEGGVLVAADYSQLELRLITHLSGDRRLMSILNNKGDVFRIIASEINRCSIDEVTDMQRQYAKHICYGIIYGMGAKSLGEKLNTSEEEAGMFIDMFKNKFRGVKEYIKETVKFVNENGYVLTLNKRRRYIPMINSKNIHSKLQAERQSVNTTIQGSAADLVKAAMVDIDRKIFDEFREVRKPRLVLQMHDELIYECQISEKERLVQIVKTAMEQAAELEVVLPVKIKTGISWGDLQDWS